MSKILLAKDIKRYKFKIYSKYRRYCLLSGYKTMTPVLDHDHTTGYIRNVIDRDVNNDNQHDINKIADYTVKTGGITFKVGAFILALIRFVLLIFIIFILCLALVKLKKNNKI